MRGTTRRNLFTRGGENVIIARHKEVVNTTNACRLLRVRALRHSGAAQILQLSAFAVLRIVRPAEVHVQTTSTTSASAEAVEGFVESPPTCPLRLRCLFLLVLSRLNDLGERCPSALAVLAARHILLTSFPPCFPRDTPNRIDSIVAGESGSSLSPLIPSRVPLTRLARRFGRLIDNPGRSPWQTTHSQRTQGTAELPGGVREAL